MALKDLMFRNEIDELVHGAYHALDTPDGPATRYYSDEQIALLPEVARDWALGVGNPVPHADLQVGETVLDLGCGAGIDVLLAAHEVGPTGRVIGLDLLEEMLERGRKAAADAGADNVEFVQGKMDGIPLPDESVDIVISNGAINLAARKSRVFAEAFRVLKPGGRFCVADITIHEEDLPPEILTHPSAWAG